MKIYSLAMFSHSSSYYFIGGRKTVYITFAKPIHKIKSSNFFRDKYLILLSACNVN